jgi:predicted glycosyltransferase
MVDNLVNNLSQSTNIIILCRYQDQVSDVEKRYGDKARVIKNVVDGVSLICSVDLFIGAGGTMTTEAALLGKPTISISPFRFYVEKYLVRSGLAKRSSNAHDLLILVRKMLQSEAYAARQKKIAKRTLDNMEDPLIKLLSFIRDCA